MLMSDSLSRLKQVVKKKIGNKAFVVASHSEPYIHYYQDNEVKWRKAGGGLVTALDPVMQVCGGTWIASSAGDADKDVENGDGLVKVPPENGTTYSLKRIYLEKPEVEA